MTDVNSIIPASASRKPSVSSGAAQAVRAGLTRSVSHSESFAPHCPLPPERHISPAKCFLLSPASRTHVTIILVTSPACFSGSRLEVPVDYAAKR